MPLSVFSRMQISFPPPEMEENWATPESQRKTQPAKENLNEMPPGMQLKDRMPEATIATPDELKEGYCISDSVY